MELTLDLLIKYLGNPEKQYGDECEWQCPYCQDTHRDNLKFSKSKGILYCFASGGEHSRRILSEIFKNEYKNNPGQQLFRNSKISEKRIQSNEQREKYSLIYEEDKQIEFINYAAVNMISLMGNLEAQTILLQKRGITKETAMNVVLGYDAEKRRWVIPTIKYSTQYETHLIGFEYRPLNFSKDGLRREKDTPTALAQINAYNNQGNLIIVEGYFDGYALYQHLTEQNKINDYHIVTCSNGVGGLYNQLSIVDFSKYENTYLLIDNDETSIPIAQKICNKYPKIINLSATMFKKCGCKDFNEHYMNCIYNKRIKERYNQDEIKKIKNINELINYVKEKESTIYTEKINKDYCINKAKSKEQLVIECIQYFSKKFNKSVIAKILTGSLSQYRLSNYGDYVINSKYYKVYKQSDYYEIREIIQKLIDAGIVKTENYKKWGKIYI